MSVSTTLVKIATSAKILNKSKKKETEKVESNQGRGWKRPTLQEMQAKEYSFPNSEITRILEDLLKLKLIELPEMKRLEEANKVNEPNYCKYNRLISHSTQRCFILKEKIMQLASQRKILLEEEKEVAATNQTAAVIGSVDLATESWILDMSRFEVQFGSFDPV